MKRINVILFSCSFEVKPSHSKTPDPLIPLIHSHFQILWKRISPLHIVPLCSTYSRCHSSPRVCFSGNRLLPIRHLRKLSVLFSLQEEKEKSLDLESSGEVGRGGK